MSIQFELWHLITLLLSFFACVAAFGKFLVDQFEKRMDERHKNISEVLQQHMAEEERMLGKIDNLERDFLRFQAEMPLQYVRREDYVRNQTIIEAKLDALALSLQNAQLKGAFKS